jgi:undecaprenyl-diphosphatase
LFAALLVAVEADGLDPLPGDRRASHAIVRHWRAQPVKAAVRISHYAGGWKGVLLLAAAAALSLLLVRAWKKALFVGLAVAILLLVPLLKVLVRRPPPPGSETRFSFPSGHAVGSLALAAATVYVVRKTPLRWPAAALAALYVVTVAVAVVAEQGHWPSDVLGGWLLAAAWIPLARAVAELPGRRAPAKG